MNPITSETTESWVLPHGFEIDRDEGWSKIVSHQFGGQPGRAFPELIQNGIDGYPSSIPMEERKAEIVSGDRSISITDYGEGLSLQRIELLCTLGGTDKRDDPSKIGRFGMGFYAIFNPRLGTKRVVVRTRCEGAGIELCFEVEIPGKCPKISVRMLEQPLPFSTRIEVEFEFSGSVARCLEHAREVLAYYPCRITVNGLRVETVWEKAKAQNAKMFKSGGCHGFLLPERWGSRATLLCKYERLMELDLTSLGTGGHGMKYNLSDYHASGFPVLRNIQATVNCDALSVTISRDSFYLDGNYHAMKATLANELLSHFGSQEHHWNDTELVLANQYVFRSRLKGMLGEAPAAADGRVETNETAIMRRLTAAKVHRLKGKPGMFSLQEIEKMRSKDLPVFFAETQANLEWLGGAFKHDFVVLGQIISLKHGAPDFYGELFRELFKDVVNLDTIAEDAAGIRKLVERGIVDKSTLAAGVNIVASRRLRAKERKLLEELNRVLSDEGIRKAVENNIQIPIKGIKAGFFEMKEQGVVLATGLFNQNGQPIDEGVPDNFRETGAKPCDPPKGKQPLLLGICRDHPLIKHVMGSDDPSRGYYLLTFLARELTMCQKILTPYSPFYYVVKERLANDMRRAIIGEICSAG